MSRFEEQIVRAVQGRNPLIHLLTSEEDRVVDRLKPLAPHCFPGGSLTTWSCVRGLEPAVEGVDTRDPAAALQHIIADMWADMKMAKENVYFAVTALDRGLPCTAEVAMAKSMMSDAAWRTTRMGIQIHGGIGTTRDHDAGLYYRRANQSLFLYGSPEFWREKLAIQLGI